MCNRNRWKFVLAAAGTLCLSGSLWGAFAVDPEAQDKPGEEASEPAYIAELDAIGNRLEVPKYSPQERLPGGLLAQAVRIDPASAAADESAETPKKALPRPAPEDAPGMRPWHLLAFMASLCFAGYAFWRMRAQYKPTS
jgi:hypothetical protein